VGCAGTCRGGRGAGLELGGDVGAPILACVRAVRAGERLKERGRDWRAGPTGQRHKRASARQTEAPTRRPHRTVRGRKEERRGSAPTGGARLSETEGARARLGLVGRLGCFALFFFSEFSNCFSISFSLGFSIQI
jgi:hypothetical protein